MGSRREAFHGIEAEEDADTAGHAEGEQHHRRRHHHRPARRQRQPNRRPNTQTDAHQSTQQCQHHRLQQELGQHIRRRCSQGHAQADLACPFRHRHQHDVHDADAADRQRQRGNHRHQQLQRVRQHKGQFGHLLDAADVEIVLAGLEAMVLTHHPCDFADRSLRQPFVANRCQDQSQAFFADQFALERRHRHKDLVILVVPGRVASLGSEDADHLEPQGLDADRLADGADVGREELVPHGVAEDTDVGGGAHLVGTKKRPVANLHSRTPTSSGVVPLRRVVQWRTPVVAVRKVSCMGATPRSKGPSCLRRAVASVAFSGARSATMPERDREPARTRMRFLPRLPMRSSSLRRARRRRTPGR